LGVSINFSQPKEKEPSSTTPLNAVLNYFILALNDSVAAFDYFLL